MTATLTLCALVFVWCFIFFLFFKAIGWAKQRKTGAYVFGALVQMLLPDPQVTKTIAVIEQQKEQKEEAKQTQDDKVDK